MVMFQKGKRKLSISAKPYFKLFEPRPQKALKSQIYKMQCGLFAECVPMDETEEWPREFLKFGY